MDFKYDVIVIGAGLACCVDFAAEEIIVWN